MLYLEEENRNGEKGCVIVGINPGRSGNNPKEIQYYLNNSCSYDSALNFWQENFA